MDDKLVSILREKGPMLSGRLALEIESKYNIANVTARKWISRAKSPVQKLFMVSFDKNQKFIYLEEQYQSDRYHSALYNAIKTSSLVNWICIQAFCSQNGYVSKEMLPALIASPVKNLKGHKRIDRVIKDLIECGIVEDFSDDYWRLAKWVPDSLDNFSRARALEIIKRNIAYDFMSWAAGINMSGYNSGRVYTKDAEFCGFQWGYTAPSYVSPMYDEYANKNGFVIADVFYGNQATKDNVRFFVEKVSIIRKAYKGCRFMPVILLESADAETLSELKKHKIVVAILGNFFDSGYTDILKDILESFSNAAAILSKNPEKIDRLLSNIGKMEGRLNNLIGDLFELMVGSYYKCIGSNSIVMNKNIETYEGKRNEIDILIERDGKNVIVECKALKSKIDDSFVEKWIGNNIKNIRTWLLCSGRENIQKQRFEIWSLGGFTEKAKRLLDKEIRNNRKYEIAYYGRDEIVCKFREAGLSNFINKLDQYCSYGR